MWGYSCRRIVRILLKQIKESLLVRTLGLYSLKHRHNYTKFQDETVTTTFIIPPTFVRLSEQYHLIVTGKTGV